MHRGKVTYGIDIDSKFDCRLLTVAVLTFIPACMVTGNCYSCIARPLIAQGVIDCR